MTLDVMSQLPAIEHVYTGVGKAFLGSATYLLHQPADIIKLYTSEPRIKKRLR